MILLCSLLVGLVCAMWGLSGVHFTRIRYEYGEPAKLESLFSFISGLQTEPLQ